MPILDLTHDDPLGAGELRWQTDFHVVRTAADLLPSATEGSMALTLDNLALYVRKGNIWTPVASAGDPPPPTVVNASETEAGVVRLATQDETNTGVDDTEAITPLKLANRTATEERAGLVELATAAEVQAGTAGNLIATVARLKAELDTRVVDIPGGGPTVLSGATVPTTGTTSNDLRGTGGIAADARGVRLMFQIGSQGGALRVLFVDSADVTPGGSSPRVGHNGTGIVTSQLQVPFGTGLNAGKITFLADPSLGSVASVTAWVTGYYR